MPDQPGGGPLTQRPTMTPVDVDPDSGVEVDVDPGADLELDVRPGPEEPAEASDATRLQLPEDGDVPFDVTAEVPADAAGPAQIELPDDGDLPFDGAAPVTPAGTLPPGADPLAVAFESWRRELAGSGVRDTLLAVGRTATSDWLDLTQSHPSGLAQLFAARPTKLSSLFREAGAHAAARRQARAIREAATTLAARRGVHGCCLAIGVATWTAVHPADPTDPAAPDRAPLVHAPVVLRGCGVSPRGAGHDDYDLDLDGAVVVNPELVRVLGEVYGVQADGQQLAALAHGPKGFDPRPVYTWLEEHCAGLLPDFAIERSLVLATFSAGSGAVLADLDAAVPAISVDPLLGKAARASVPVPAVPVDEPAAEGAEAPAPRPGESRRLAVVGRLGPRAPRPAIEPPEEPDPRDELLVLDLDPAQQRAVEAVLRGDHVAIEGPPGSGGTQALAAAVAALVAAGRRVLVVGPRRVSAEALLARFEQAGIGDLVLDLQDAAGGRAASGATATVLRSAMRSAERRPTTLLPTGELPPPRGQAALEPGGAGPVPAGRELVAASPGDGDPAEADDPEAGAPGAAETLRQAREVLDGAASALHRLREPWSVSAYDAMVAIAELGGRDLPPRSAVHLTEEVLTQLDSVTRERLRVHLHAAATASAFTLSRIETRWYDARVGTEDEARAAHEAARTLRSALEQARGAMDAVAADAGLRPAADAAGWLPLLDVLLGVRATVDVMLPAVYEQPLDELISATAPRSVRGNDGRTRRERRRIRRQAQALVRPGVHLVDLYGALVRARHQARQWAELSLSGEGPRVVVGLTDTAIAVERVTRALDVLAGVFDGTSTDDPRAMSLDDLERRVYDLAGDAAGILGQPRRATLLTGLRAAGLGDLVDDLQGRRVPPEAIDAEFDLVWWSSVLASIIRSDERLSRHDPDELRRAAADLRAAEHAHIAAGAHRVRAAVRARAGAVLAACPDQVEKLREALQRTDVPPRPADLVRSAGDVVAALCPVWVMSPDTVASCLAPALPGGPPVVDVVVVDDAGHVALAEVAAVLARGGQLVVAGDRRRQGGPLGGPTLISALAPFVTVSPLDRDHRARDGRMLVPLAPHYPEGWQLTPGVAVAPALRLEAVADGVAIPPPGELLPLSADAEVRRVVDLVAAHAARHPEESLVVVTFGDRHAERIEEALRAEVSERPALARWLAERWVDAHPEPFTIRPVDRLLGLERDAAIVSVGLARTPHGRVLHRFDLLDSDRGAGFLISAMSRARRRTTVVSCFTSDDLVVERLRSDGARLLRDVLLAAGGRGAASAGRTAVSADGLVSDLRERLATAGLPVQSRVGDGAWPLDIAVADPRAPGRMLVAVDLDGPAFATRRARERERQRPERWEDAGWSYVKVAALDLFRDAALEVERIRTAWERALVDTRMAAAPGPEDDRPVLPDRSEDDSDSGWGEAGEESGDDRLQRDRPPHWE